MDITEIKKSALTEIEKAKSAEELEKIRIFYLGRQDGKLTAVLRSLKDLPIGKRREIGPKAQALKRELENFLEEKLKKFQVPSSKLQVDLTAPGKRFRRGHLHPLTLVDREIRRIFLSMNFSVVEGPEVETEYYNFDALNIPPNHPAREAWDTFWIKRNPNLRIHPNATNETTLSFRKGSDYIFILIGCSRVVSTESPRLRSGLTLSLLKGSLGIALFSNSRELENVGFTDTASASRLITQPGGKFHCSLRSLIN